MKRMADPIENDKPFSTTVRAVMTGRVRPLGARAVASGIDKHAQTGPLRIGRDGIAGDEQGDPKVHGGPEKAVHHYPHDHYALWRAETPAFAERLSAPGAFGENISTEGITEAGICIGDVFRLGTALVQVAQGRQPCWKLNERFADKRMAKRLQDTGRTGWYYRVLEEGAVEAGAPFALVERPAPDWPLARIQVLLYRDTMNWDALAAISELPHLAESWRKLARRRLERRRVEDWSSRLERDA